MKGKFLSVKVQRIGVLLLVFLVGLGMSAPVSAGSFPGENGLIAFTTNRDGNDEIYTANPDGSNPTNLTNHPGQDRAASWSADGKQIAFQSNRDGNWEIYTMLADGSNQRRITNNSQDDLAPSWSADGMQLAFVRVLPDGDKEIFTMNMNGTQQANITNHPGLDTDPSWSPDGSKILFTSHRIETGARDIYTMKPDGGNVEIYVGGAGSKMQGSWAPDGKKILMKGDLERLDLYVTGPDIYRQLTYDFNEENVAPTGAWSPDGTKIVFYMAVDCSFEPSCPPEGSSLEVYTMDPYDPDSRRNISNRDDAADGEAIWQPIPLVTPIQIATTELPPARARSHYSYPIQTTGGAGPKTFSLTQGELPKGLALNPASGLISGIPKHHGTYTFTLQVRDDTGTDDQSFALVVNKKKAPLPSLSISTNISLNGSDNIIFILQSIYKAR